jgi:hypothetical protein
VLRLIATGNANKEIAARRSLAEESAKHRIELFLSRISYPEYRSIVQRLFSTFARGRWRERWQPSSRSGAPSRAIPLILAIHGIPVVLAALRAALAMVEPGAWSIDARLFGRSRIDIPELQIIAQNSSFRASCTDRGPPIG